MWRTVALVAVVAFLVIALVCWLWLQNPERLFRCWNVLIRRACNSQDHVGNTGRELLAPLMKGSDLPKSLRDAWGAPSFWARSFHQMVSLYHSQIQGELDEELSLLGPDAEFLSGAKARSQPRFLQAENCWNPLWVKRTGELGARLPTLRAIASMYPEVRNLHVAIFHPGMTVTENVGFSRGVLRYHYGLKVPQGDAGLDIDEGSVHWQEREGFVWDGTRGHSAWNRGDAPCAIIMADIDRDLGWLTTGTRFLYWIVSKKIGPTDRTQEMQRETLPDSIYPAWEQVAGAKS